MKNAFFLALIFLIAVSAGCRAATSGGSPAEIKQVSVEQAKRAAEENNAQFIDVRTPEEYRSGHAPKAALFPLDALERELARLDRDKPVYVICQTGRRSQRGAEILQRAGFGEVYNVAGGTSAWTSAGFPVEKVEP
jgi:rhodanese-related sulfurtransferase